MESFGWSLRFRWVGLLCIGCIGVIRAFNAQTGDTSFFQVTFWSPKWRSLNSPLKRSLRSSQKGSKIPEEPGTDQFLIPLRQAVFALESPWLEDKISFRGKFGLIFSGSFGVRFRGLIHLKIKASNFLVSFPKVEIFWCLVSGRSTWRIIPGHVSG